MGVGIVSCRVERVGGWDCTCCNLLDLTLVDSTQWMRKMEEEEHTWRLALSAVRLSLTRSLVAGVRDGAARAGRRNDDDEAAR